MIKRRPYANRFLKGEDRRKVDPAQVSEACHEMMHALVGLPPIVALECLSLVTSYVMSREFGKDDYSKATVDYAAMLVEMAAVGSDRGAKPMRPFENGVVDLGD